jgi:hypothetical protein
VINEYVTFVKAHNIDIHVGIVGFLITVLGFGATLVKIYKLNKNSRELAFEIKRTREAMVTIDIVRDLSGAMELLKAVRDKLISNQVGDVPSQLMNLRLALIKIRDTHPDVDQAFNLSVQKLITDLQSLESSMLGTLISSNDYSTRRQQRDLKTLAGCLNDLQTFLVRTQTLAASPK